MSRADLVLPARLRPLLDALYPRVSDDEMARRHAALGAAMAAREIDHVLFYGAQYSGSAVQWLSRWPTTAEAVGVFTPGERCRLFIHHYNHIPLARRLATECEVDWAGRSGIGQAIDLLKARDARPGRIGILGPLGHEGFGVLSEVFGPVQGLGPDWVRLRKVKSAEELDWFRVGAHFSDLGMRALSETARPGVSERELADAVERAYVGLGGRTGIHFIGATAMGNPSVAVPCQFHSSRRVQAGDVVFAEITAEFFEYAGQVLRSFTIAADPTPLYRDLHQVAEATFEAITGVLRAGARPAEVVKASRVIEDAGFTTIDDVLHGYGGGYFPPVLASASRAHLPVPDEPFEAGQLVVVQPNVVTRDLRAGVQTGEMLLVTETGVERMHGFPRGFQRLG